MNTQAYMPRLVAQAGGRVSQEAMGILGGVIALSLLAQVAIPLPWTPVPITGQTFGVALVSLLYGRLRGFAVVLAYLGLAAAGLPVLAMGRVGLAFGPTAGYLIGMVFASFLMGWLADIGWTKSFTRTWIAATSGSAITFACGVLVLSAFIPNENLFVAGVLPFIPGDVLKTLLATSIVHRVAASGRRRN